MAAAFHVIFYHVDVGKWAGKVLKFVQELFITPCLPIHSTNLGLPWHTNFSTEGERWREGGSREGDFRQSFSMRRSKIKIFSAEEFGLGNWQTMYELFHFEGML